MNAYQNNLMAKLFAVVASFRGTASKLVAMLAFAGIMASQVRADDGSFSDPYRVGGYWGTTNVLNSLALPSGIGTIGGKVESLPVWFKFTATNDGVVTIDTVGSLTLGGKPLDTIVAVFVGTNLANLSQIAANDEIYPSQNNSYSQSFFTNSVPPSGPRGQNTYYANANSLNLGPSVVRFTVKQGSSYYVAVDATSSGSVSFNWAFNSGGVFRFASEVFDKQGLTDTNGNPYMVVPAAEGTPALVTITRVAGSSGRCSVRYTVTNLPVEIIGANGYLTNNDIAAVPGTHFSLATGILTFNDFEMSKTISVPTTVTTNRENRSFLVTLSQPQTDPFESALLVSAPRVDPVLGQITVRSLSKQSLPNVTSQIESNPPPFTFVYTNWSGQNSTFNFSATRYVVKRAQGGNVGYPLTVRIERGGTPGSVTNSATIFYSVNPDVPYNNNGFVPNVGVNFPLSPGSDYAVPDPATSGNVFATTPDFTVPGGYSGSLTFAANDNAPQYIPITIYPTTNANFNKDFQIQLYALDNSSPARKIRVGMIDSTVVTILHDDQHPPAGAVDQLYNPDYSLDFLDMNVFSSPPNMAYPGTDGEVYGVGTFGDNKAIIVGQFYSYNGTSRNCIARLNADGSLDTSFNPGTGVGAVPGFNFPPVFINTVVVDALTTNNRVYIGGSFTSYNGTPRGNIARISNNGSLDASFNPGSGANGPIYAIHQQLDGRIIIGGSFTSYNGQAITNLARLNSNGSLDTTFNPGGAINGPVYALGQHIVDLGITRAAGGTDLEDVNLIDGLGSTSGILTIDYDFLVVPDQMKVFYGNTNGILIYDTGLTNSTAHLVIPFGPVGAFATNAVTIVMNQGRGVPGTVWFYEASIRYTASDRVYVGGDFTSVAGRINQDYITRFNSNGSLDTTFNPNAGPNAPVHSLAVQTNGQVVIGGEFTTVNGLPYNRLARLSAVNGAVDTSFQTVIGANDTVFSINRVLDGRFYVGGRFTAVNNTRRLGFTRLNTDGTVDTSFLDTAYNQFAGLTRENFNDPIGAVFASAEQVNGGIIIGGSFDQVGGGQVNTKVRPTSYANAVVTANSRDGVRNRNNVARLIGGETAGPGNLGFLEDSYSANKSASSIFVNLIRKNGNLGYASANFFVSPLLAKSGLDFAYSAVAPTYAIHWNRYGARDNINNPFTRMHSDGLYGTNTFLTSITGSFVQDPQAKVQVTVFNNTASSGDLNARFQLDNPANQDQFFLGGQNIPLGVALGTYNSPMTIVDDSAFRSGAGVVTFSSGDYTANSTNAAVSVLRTNGAYGTVSVNYTTVTNGSTAVLNSDYRASSGILTFLAGQTNKTFNVQVLSTNYITPVEKIVNLVLFNLQSPFNNLASFGTSNAVLRIINPNFAGFLNFSTNAYFAKLSRTNAYLTVTRTVGSKGTLSVTVITTNGTAFSPTNYLATTNVLVWNNGDVSPRVVAVPLVNDDSFGTPDLTFGVSLTSPLLNGTNNSSLLGSVSNAVVTIQNDNTYGVFSFSQPTYQVNENGGSAVLNVIRTGSLRGSVDVDYQTVDGTAVDPSNYSGTIDTLSFAPGETLQTIVVPIVDDAIANNLAPEDFKFNVQLTAVSPGATLGAFTNAEVRLVDAQGYIRPPGGVDDTYNAIPGINGPVLSLDQQTDGSIVAGGSFNLVNGTPRNNFARLNPDGTTDILGFLNGQSGVNGVVNALVSQTDDRVLLGGLFTTVNGVVRNRLARVMTDGSLDTSFNPGVGADDAVNALAEGFLGGARRIYAGGVFQNINSQPRPYLARLDNAGNVDTSFNIGIGPNATVYAIAVYSTNSPNAGKLLVGGAFTSFNATPVSYLVRLNADGSVDTNYLASLGVNAPVRAIAIANDDSVLVGGDFTNAFDAYGTYPSPHLVRIYEDGGGVIDEFFSQNLADGPNGRVNALAIQVDNKILAGGEFSQFNGVTRNNFTRVNDDGTLDTAVNFGTGADASVYAVLSQTYDQAMVLGGGFSKFNGIARDHIVRLYGGSQAGNGSIEFTSADYSAPENSLSASITVRRVGGTTGTNQATLVTSDGTAVESLNYHGVTNLVVFPPGEVIQTVPIPLIVDGLLTPDLTVNLSLTDAGAYGDQTNAVLTILNADNGVAFSSPDFYVSRNVLTGIAPIYVVRSGTNGTSSVDLVTTTNGTAVPGVDFVSTNVTLTFNPGESVKQVQIPILQPGSPISGDVTVFFTLTNPVGTYLYSPSNSLLTIRGTNQPGVIGMATNAITVTEGSGSALLSVIRTNGSAGSALVRYTTRQGTAVPGLNYVTTSGSLTFGDGETNRTITVPLVDNSVVQGPVTFSVSLTNITGATLSTATQTVVTVTDNDAAVLFALSTNVVDENSGFANISVLRLYNTNVTCTVNYATVPGVGPSGALPTVNYTTTSGTLVFSNGETIKSVSVPLLPSPTVTGDLFFSMRLTNATGGLLIAPSNTVIVVQDADAGISFTNSTVSVLKNAGTAKIVVVCSNPRVEPLILSSNDIPLSVDYYTVDGTAQAGIHYEPRSGTLYFTNGIATNTFDVTIYDNPLVTGDRAFSVILTNVTFPGQLVAPSTQSVVIAESNSGLRFSAANYSVFENGLFAKIDVLRTGYADKTVSVNFAVTNGTAIAGANFVPTNGVLIFTNGVTSRSFNVPVIANNLVQPNLNAVLRLSNPTNGVLMTPNPANLIILEADGSYVVPAGAQLVSESGAGVPNGILDPSENVQVLFGFRASAGINVTNLVARLLATNGVVAPSPASNAYGPLVVYGHSASRPFNFTVNATNTQLIAPTFELYDNAKFIGTAVFGFTVGTWTVSFTNTNSITIRDNTNASPYPSVITVSGLGSTLVKATATLNRLTHTYPADVAAVMVMPSGTNTLLMANAGDGFSVTNIVLNFDDAATNSLPRFNRLTTSTNKPCGYLPLRNFP